MNAKVAEITVSTISGNTYAVLKDDDGKRVPSFKTRNQFWQVGGFDGRTLPKKIKVGDLVEVDYIWAGYFIINNDWWLRNL